MTYRYPEVYYTQQTEIRKPIVPVMQRSEDSVFFTFRYKKAQNVPDKDLEA
jgi:hypothetical protein